MDTFTVHVYYFKSIDVHVVRIDKSSMLDVLYNIYVFLYKNKVSKVPYKNLACAASELNPGIVRL